MTQPIALLNSEHRVINSAIDQATILFKDILNGQGNLTRLIPYIDFFRTYADQYHHHKEEEILFPEMVKRNELIGQGVIQEMLENHKDFRIMLAEIENHVLSGQSEKAFEKFKGYTQALQDHIAVEDDEVFHMAESLFSNDELENIYYRFLDCDRELDESRKLELEKKVINQF